MKKLLLLLITVGCANVYAQTNHSINTMGNSWAPNNLVIDLGDSVTWTNNNGGLHNINGTTATYPSNPESFGMLTSSQNWVYGYRFNVAGVYDYRCDVHSSMMLGKITVNDGAGLNESSSNFQLYPNPIENIVKLKVNALNYEVTVFDMLGNSVYKKKMMNEHEIDLTNLNPGAYLLEVNIQDEKSTQRVIKK